MNSVILNHDFTPNSCKCLVCHSIP